MQIVTNEQIYDRWEKVPEALKEAFFSVDNGELVWKTCESAGLSGEVIDNVLIVMGNILLGFTHINDLAKELQSIPGMTPEAVDRIIFQIDTQIFDPVKVEILKLYAEMTGAGERAEGTATSESIQGGVVEATQKEASLVARQEGGATAPAMIATEPGSVVMPVPAMGVQRESVEIRKVRIEEGQHETPSVPSEVHSQASSPEGPIMIHSEADLVPVAQKKRALSSFGGMFGFRREQEQKKEEPGVTAQVSMVEGLGRKPEDMAKTAQQPVRVVHYTSAKTPENIFAQPTAPQGQPMVSISTSATAQGQSANFEPKIVDLNALVEVKGVIAPEPNKMAPVPPMPEEDKPIAPMPKTPEPIVMKTPQRIEVVAEQAPPMKEIKLSEIPVADDVVDLRSLERVMDKKE